MRKDTEEETAGSNKKADTTVLSRTVLSLPPQIAPYKTTILPLVSDEKHLTHVHKLAQILARENISFKIDTSGQFIGRRYARCDELRVPLVLTVDDQIFDDIVALRECDSCEQIKGKTGEIILVIQDLVNNQLLSVHFSLHTCQIILFY